MADFRDHVYDRIHALAAQLGKAVSPENPARSPSTKKTVVDGEVQTIMCELLSLNEVLHRTP